MELGKVEGTLVGKPAGKEAGKVFGRDKGIGATGTITFIEEFSSIFTVGSSFAFLQENNDPTQSVSTNILKHFMFIPKKKGRP